MPRMIHGLRDPGDGPSIATLDRALGVLDELAQGPAGRGVSELAQTLEMPKGSIHRILVSLSSRGLVRQDPSTQRYSLGPAVLRLGHVYLARADVTVLAGPVLDDLSLATRETATLSVRVGLRQRIYAAQVLPDREVRMSVTRAEPYPLHVGGSGRALLAFLPQAEQDAYLTHWGAVADPAALREGPDELREALRLTRSQGWTLSRGDHMPGAASVAAPVLDHRGEAVAALSVCGPVQRFGESVPQHCAHLLEATASLSARFGWNG